MSCCERTAGWGWQEGSRLGVRKGGYHVFEVCSSLDRQLRKSWQSSMAFLSARWANSLLASTSVKLGLEVNSLVPTIASTEFGTISENSSYFKLLVQGWFPHTHTSLPLPPLSFFFFFLNHINPTSLFEKPLQNQGKHLPGDVVSFPGLVVPRLGLMQGRVTGARAASDYQELRQGCCNTPASLFQMKTWEMRLLQIENLQWDEIQKEASIPASLY